jgi:hypothetical protein
MKDDLDRLIGDVEPPLGEQVLHISVAQGEAQVGLDLDLA